MFEIEIDKNQLAQVEACTFSELNIKEREHLQEWLANTPSALGEELLVIQKEFDGFKDTRERLDLLALDKEGTLVIIENKLDDTGRDVVWQALKYVAYCSQLKKSDIIQIFQGYLNQQNKSEDASEVICDFMEVGSIDEANINVGTNQRFILVAANFRKEVTSTVIWLNNNGINAQCMKVTPYRIHEKILLDINQIIPMPEAEDYMIGMSSKQVEEKKTRVEMTRSKELRLNFWNRLLEYFRENGFDLYRNVNSTRDHWLNAGSGVSGCYYTLIFSKREARVEFGIARSSQEENKRVFDFLSKRKDEIETRFGEKFDWHRLDDKKMSRICFAKPFDGYDEEQWGAMIMWLFEQMKNLEAAINPIIPEIQKQLQ